MLDLKEISYRESDIDSQAEKALDTKERFNKKSLESACRILKKVDKEFEDSRLRFRITDEESIFPNHWLVTCDHYKFDIETFQAMLVFADTDLTNFETLGLWVSMPNNLYIRVKHKKKPISFQMEIDTDGFEKIIDLTKGF